MAEINKKPEKWLSKETFDNLDLSQVPVGTVINVVDTEYHRWKIEVDGGVNYGLLTYYFDTTASNLTELANALVEQKIIKGTMIVTPNDVWLNTADVFGDITTYISSAVVTSNNLTLNGSTIMAFVEAGKASSIGTNAIVGYDSLGTATVTQLY